MKKTITFILSFLILFSATLNHIYASEILPYDTSPYQTCTDIIYQDEDIIITCTLTIQNVNSGMQPYSTKKIRSISKEAAITNTKGKTLATYTLTGTFTYDGNSSTCTSAVCSTSVQNAKWYFTSQKASKSGKKALGSFTLKNASTNKAKSGQLTITCSKTGVIS